MLSGRKEQILWKLAQMTPPLASTVSSGAPQLVPPPAAAVPLAPPQQVPYGSTKPPAQSPSNMISPNTLKTPAVKAQMKYR